MLENLREKKEEKEEFPPSGELKRKFVVCELVEIICCARKTGVAL